LRRRPNLAFADAHGVLASASAHLGRMTEARTSFETFKSLIAGDLTEQIGARPFRRPEDRERYLAGLRMAGLVEA
jgi:hypothetical protein